MVKKSTKKKSTRKSTSHQSTAKNADDCKTCDTNDTILKAVVIVLGLAVLVAAYYVGYLVGSGASMPMMGGANEHNDLQGAPDGAVLIVEYSDFECPFCQRFYDDTYGQVKSAYGDKVVFQFKQFPLSFHPQAQKAAEAAECARDQGAIEAFHDRVFDTKQLSVASLKQHAADLGLDTTEFNTCLDSGEKADVVAQHVAEGSAAGVRGTPSFLINGELVVGAQPFAVFKQKIDAALSGAAPAPTPTQPTAPAPTPTVEVSVDDDAILGDVDAPVTIIEFSDYECPFCGRHFTQTMGLIKTNFIDTGKARYVLRDFPLSFHPKAQKAAEAAECAGEQGMYFEMHDVLFANQQSLDIANLKAYAADIGLDTAAFNECLDSGAMAQEVKDDFADGQAYGVTGTPGTFVNGKLISGAQPYAAFEAAINAALAE